jgi:hypothetical protein
VGLGDVLLRAAADVFAVSLGAQIQVVVLVDLGERGLQFLFDIRDGRRFERRRLGGRLVGRTVALGRARVRRAVSQARILFRIPHVPSEKIKRSQRPVRFLGQAFGFQARAGIFVYIPDGTATAFPPARR